MTLPKYTRLHRLQVVFTPFAPVASRDLFAGRVDQLFDVSGAISMPGRHAVIYGERGVGKTSLANMLKEVLPHPDIAGRSFRTVKVNCVTNDSFASIWERIYQALDLEVPDGWRRAVPNPDSIRMQLASLSSPAIIILDEFDRLQDDDALSLLADTMKSLSDNRTPTKLVLVGVADSLEELIGEHESIKRAAAQISVPRMAEADMSRIIDSGLGSAEMTITRNARKGIETLAEGLPHYVHSLALRAALKSLSEDRTEVTSWDVRAAIEKALDNHTVLEEYQRAVQSPRRENLFAPVLAASALAEKNRLGAFTPASVRDPLSRIMGRPYDIPAFSRHLKDFTEPDHGSVLRRYGSPRKYTYRFRDPLLQPFTVLSAIQDGLLPEEMLVDLLGAPDPIPSPGSPDPSDDDGVLF